MGLRGEYLRDAIIAIPVTWATEAAVVAGLRNTEDEFDEASDFSHLEAEEEPYHIDGDTYDYPSTYESMPMNGTDVDVVGVTHTGGFFEAYEDFFEAAIAASDGVMLEQPASEDFWEEEKFFGRIGEIAADHDLPVYQADPVDMTSTHIDWYIGMFGVAQIAEGGARPIERLQSDEDGYTRRDMLHSIRNVATGGYLFGNSLPGVMTRAGMSDDSTMDYGLDDKAGLGNTDRRNVDIAVGIDHVTKTEDMDCLVSIHGDAHADPIIGYLQDEQWRELKDVAYTPYDLISEKGVRKYEHTDDGWQQTEI